MPVIDMLPIINVKVVLLKILEEINSVLFYHESVTSEKK